MGYPEGWVQGGFPGFAMFATSDELLMADDLSGQEGAVVLVVNGPTADFPSENPEEIIEEVTTEFGLGSDMEVVDGPTAVTINDQDAAVAVIEAIAEDGTPITAHVTIVINGDNAAIMIAVTPTETAGDYLATFEAMSQTIVVSEPTGELLETENIGDLGSAGFLLYGDSVEGEIDESGSSSWSFIGLEDEVVTITVTPDDELDVIVDVLDENGASILDGPVDNSFGEEEIADLLLTTSGSFYITITSYDGSPGSYTLAITDATGAATGSGAVGGDVVLSEVLLGSIVGTEESLWTVAAVGGEFLDITVSPMTEEFDVVVDVLDENGRSLLDEPLDDSFDTEYIRILPIPDDGLYTIVITGYDGSAGDYELLVEESYLSQPASFIFATNSLEDAEEFHDFPFSALQDDLVIIQVDPVELEFDVVLQLFNDDTDELIEEVDASTGFEELLFFPPEDGNYYFRIIGFEGSTGEYDVTLVGSDLTFFELAIGDLVIGRFGENSFIEYFIGVDDDQTLTLFAETGDEIDLVLEILDFDDNLLATADGGFAGEDEDLVFTFETGGLYIIRISDLGQTGSGKFLMTVE
jgi:hypothetical protein